MARSWVFYCIVKMLMTKTRDKNHSIRKASIIAGASLLLMTILAAYANFGVLERLTVSGDTANTAYNFSNSIGSVRVAILCFLLVVVIDVIVALALYRVLAPVHKGISKLAALFRLLYAGVFVAAITQLIQISQARGGEAYANYIQDNYSGNYIMNIENNFNAFHVIWSVGLILFGIHLLLIGYLAYKASYMPKFLGILLAIAGLGYLIDSLGYLYISNYNANIAGITFIGEAILIFWLLIKGRRVKVQG